MTKKLNHNANERDRRKKINCLCSSLRSLLPSTDHMKKLSIPATVSHVVKYIPELQQQVEGLMKKKEELLLRICGRDEGDILGINKESQTQNAATNNYNSSCVSSASWISDNELVIHISSNKIHGTPLSEILPCFEKDGLLLLNAFTFESFGGRIFYNLHFQVLNFK
ncbi:Transcription factor ORG2 [Quillaja saponaria]|uniref:Transcription factor ORG2 n=1 Tax=Quillaja saponaria TaxID=32244 RepID=A0AAD7Q910_QUISA|nr:Transcription factor ORG2 [Quillaja saponaria]